MHTTFFLLNSIDILDTLRSIPLIHHFQHRFLASLQGKNIIKLEL